MALTGQTTSSVAASGADFTDANQWLQYRAQESWRDYLYGEKVYIVLSLTAKSALAWQIFAGTLAA